MINEKFPTGPGVEPEAFVEATICPLHEVFARSGVCHFCGGDRRLLVVRRAVSPDHKDHELARLRAENEAMRAVVEAATAAADMMGKCSLYTWGRAMEETSHRDDRQEGERMKALAPDFADAWRALRAALSALGDEGKR